jgi:hypothetical protein
VALLAHETLALMARRRDIRSPERVNHVGSAMSALRPVYG